MSLRMTNSLTFRITLLFAAASTVVLLALGFLIRDSVDQHFEEQDLAVLEAHMKPVRQRLAHAQSGMDMLLLAGRVAVLPHGDARLAVVVRDRDGKPYYTLGASDMPPALLDAGRQVKPKTPLVWHEGERFFRGISEQVTTGIPDSPSAIVAGALDITHHEHFMALFQRTLWLFVAFAAVLMGLLGWLAARHGLGPLRKMQQDAAAISASRLDQRLSVEQLPAELAELGNTVNGMLARLEDSFRRLSDFSADIAHELRTPVSNLMTQTQVSLSKPRSTDEYRDILASNAEELERMARMIADMLFLAKADHGLIMPQPERMSLHREFAGLFEFYEAVAEERNVRLELHGDAEMAGDRLMLRRAFSNLLSNAVRHTPAGAAVTVGISSGGGQAEIAIANPGRIPPEHLPRLFDRFYRVDPSRHESSENAGLGLAITRSIVQIHGGNIVAESKDGVTTFRMHLPANV